MTRGRPTEGLSVIDRLDAPRAARRRVHVVMATLAGQLSIIEACGQLGVQRTRFYSLRREVLQAALDAVSRRPRGRPPARRDETTTISALAARIRELELTLRTAALRSEIALTMPFLLDRAAGGKKTAARARASVAASRRAERRQVSEPDR